MNSRLMKLFWDSQSRWGEKIRAARRMATQGRQVKMSVRRGVRMVAKARPAINRTAPSLLRRASPRMSPSRGHKICRSGSSVLIHVRTAHAHRARSRPFME